MSRDISISSFLYHLDMSDAEFEQSLSTESSPEWCLQKDVLDILNGALSNYDECKNAKQRSTVIKALNISLSTLLEAEGIPLPKDLSAVGLHIHRCHLDLILLQVIGDYLEEHSTVDDGKQLGPAALKPRKWTTRRVFVTENQDRISHLCDQLACTSDRQNKDWIPQYQRAVNQLFEELSEDEAESLRQTAVEWNQYGPSEQVQKQ
jgi:hypothetical protein